MAVDAGIGEDATAANDGADGGGRRNAPLTLRASRSGMVGVPAEALADAAFNDAPRPLRIHGTRQQNPALFTALDNTADAETAADVFQHYMAFTFGLNPDFSGSEGADGRRRFRASYLRLLKGWMFDSNNAEGAVMKGWVESRFGLIPTFHREPIRKFASEAWTRYSEQKMSSRFHNNDIHRQLDLLYEYAQWWIGRGWPASPIPAGATHLTLYRGVNEFEEHHIVARPDKRTAVVRLNNLCSFSVDRDIAGQFGDWILEARVPLVKIVFFRDILPRYPFNGEGEYLVVGGDYRVTVSVH